jgi:hypothetical protein
MKNCEVVISVCILLMVASLTYARGGGHGSSHPGCQSAIGQRTSRYGSTCARDRHGHIRRDAHAKQEFMDLTGYPYGRRCSVVDHIVPLYRGGCDCPANTPWQTIDAPKAKDQWK